MARAARTCSTCPAVISAGSRCPTCTATAERRRGTTKQRGYSGAGHRTFRTQVLARDPICTTPDCYMWATVADHYPISRRDLVASGADPNDPHHGRGLCKRHHDQSTALHQPGGINTHA
jgi:5-methylcytosine-specific restriction enzyme A